MLSSFHPSNLFLPFPVTLGCHSPQGKRAALHQQKPPHEEQWLQQLSFTLYELKLELPQSKPKNICKYLSHYFINLSALHLFSSC